ncbi:MAG: CopL family metal-binding regulatory protein [Xanthomonadales bacterium]|nr:CopL family metal-binding regulatory protein [Xanthomonadales bacterium]
MSVWSILLRVLLSVALVLNSATGAFAATRMQMSHAAPVSSVPAAERAAVEKPCHEASGMSQVGPTAATDPTPDPVKHPSPDCCKSASCTCMCMHGVQAPPVYAFIPTALVNHSQSIRPLLLGHISPALAHPTRPPIG